MPSEESTQPDGYVRSSKQEREKRFHTEIDKKASEDLTFMCESLGLPKNIVGSMCITYSKMFGVLEPGGIDKLNAAMSLSEKDIQNNLFEGLTNAPKTLWWSDGYWCYIHGRRGKTPDIKKLSKDLHDALKGIAKAEETLKEHEQYDFLKKKVQELENQLLEKTHEKANQTFKAPVCNYGATLARDGITFSGCRLSPGSNVSISEYCKKRMSGRPCSSYTEVIIGVGRQVKDDSVKKGKK